MRWFGTALLSLAVITPTGACSFCAGSYLKRLTLREEAAGAKLVVCGPLSNPRVDPNNPTAGGMTDLGVESVLKDDPWLKGRKVITLPRYTFVDAKNPPRYVVFCDLLKDRLDPYRGELVKSDAFLTYMRGTVAIDAKDTVAVLRHAAKFLDSEDESVSFDAFLEFAKANDREVGAAAKSLDPAKLRKLLADPKTPEERLGVFAFMLGACGTDEDAAFLAKLLADPAERYKNVLGGILGGYIALKPKEGWQFAGAVLGDPKKPLRERLSVLGTVKFYQAWKPAEAKPNVLALYRDVVEQGELADLAVEDLRRWGWWELTGPIVAAFDRKTHQSQLVRRSIVRYALTCPTAEAKAFVAKTRKSDGGLVTEIEEYLREFEQVNPPR